MGLLDRFLRGAIKALGALHFRFVTSQKKRKGVSPSGKVLGLSELSNMLDASLDMWLTGGRFESRFEKKLGQFLGIKHIVAVNSGSSANLLAMATLTSYKLGERRIFPGDEVITVAAGFPATISPIIQHQAVPVFVDVDLETHNIQIDQIERALSPKTKAIMIAHTLGNPFNLEAVMALAKKYNLWVIEDNCDALGAIYNDQKTGTFGHISTCSFYPAHHITTGEGGAVATSSTELYAIALSFRDWGRDCWCQTGCDNTCQNRFGWTLGALPKGYDHKYIYSHLGYNLKMTDWQASIGVAQLDQLDSFIAKRRHHFDSLYILLKPYEGYLHLPQATEKSRPSWFGFLLSVKDSAPFTKAELVAHLEKNGIGTRPLFSGNMLRHPASLNTPFLLRVLDGPSQLSTSLTETDFQKLPITESVLTQSFWVGVWPGLSEKDLLKMGAQFSSFFDTLSL